MIYLTDRESDASDCLEYVKRLIRQGKAIEVVEVSPLCSKKQNAYLQFLFKYFASCTGYTRKEVEEEIFKRYVNEEMYYIHMVDIGKRKCVIRDLLSLTEDEMSVAIERFRNYSSMLAGIYLPSRNEEDAIKECKKMIYLNKMFI